LEFTAVPANGPAMTLGLFALLTLPAGSSTYQSGNAKQLFRRRLHVSTKNLFRTEW
jgi:hypothetical protein